MARPVIQRVTNYEGAPPVVEKKPRTPQVERCADGLYVVRMEGGGVIPNLLQGKFTSISKVNDLLALYNSTK